MSGILEFTLILTLWSGIVWGVSRPFERKFALSPMFWLGAIGLCFVPFAAVLFWPALPVAQPIYVDQVSTWINATTQAQEVVHSLSARDGLSLIYVAVMAMTMAVQIFNYLRLVKHSNQKTSKDIFKMGRVPVMTLDQSIAPYSLAWPCRRIVVPAGLSEQDRDLVIAHEQAHMRYGDPELTLILCLMGAVFWIAWPLKALIKTWRWSIELRADQYVLMAASRQTRQLYASLLLDRLKSIRKGTRPCPSAALTSHQKRRTEMRVKTILTKSNPRSKSAKALSLAAICGLALSGFGTSHLALAQSQEGDSEAKVIKRIPPYMPSDCNIPAGQTVKVSENGRGVTGYVKVIFDVNAKGKPENMKVTKSSHSCFEPASLKAVSQWVYEPARKNGRAVKAENIENLLIFIVTPDTPK